MPNERVTRTGRGVTVDMVNAALDMLEALKNLVELVEQRAPDAAHWPDVSAARAAIAKAEGR